MLEKQACCLSCDVQQVLFANTEATGTCESEDDKTKNLAQSRKQFFKVRLSDVGDKTRCHTTAREQSYLPKLSLAQSLQGFSHATAIDISMGYYNDPIGEASRKYHNE